MFLQVNVHIQYVPDRSRLTLYPVIRRHVLNGTQINSDEAAVLHSWSRGVHS